MRQPSSGSDDNADQPRETVSNQIGPMVTTSLTQSNLESDSLLMTAQSHDPISSFDDGDSTSGEDEEIGQLFAAEKKREEEKHQSGGSRR